MSNWPKAKKHRDLLISPDTYRWAIEDRGIQWVTDRFALARVDLWNKPVGERNPPPAKFSPTVLRTLLSQVRATPTVKPLWLGDADDDTSIIRIGTATYGVDSTSYRGWSSIAYPRATNRASGNIGWWQQRRGREVLVGVLMCKIPSWPDLDRSNPPRPS